MYNSTYAFSIYNERLDGRRKGEDQRDEGKRRGIKEETMKLNQNIQKLNGYYVQKIGETLL